MSQTVLVTDWIDADPLDQVASTLTEEARRRAARAVVDFVVTGLVETGMLHGDLHPGNLLIGTAGTITPVDFGVCAAVPVRLPDATSALVRSARGHDGKLALRALRELGVTAGKTAPRPDEALAAANALAGPVDHAAARFDQVTFADLAAAAHGLRVTPAAGPLEATVRAAVTALSTCGLLAEPVDVADALRALPGLDRG